MNLSRKMAIVVVIAVVVAASGFFLFQFGFPWERKVTGAIEGTVTDHVGRPVAGMVVNIVNGTTAFPEMAVTTNEEGYYQIGSVPLGTFEVAVHDRLGNRIGLESVVVRGEETFKLNFFIPTPVHTARSEGTQLKTIVVAGLGRAAGKPNQAELSLGATTEASTASEAVAKNAEIMNNVIDSLKVVISEKDIETASFSLYPRYSNGILTGFEVTHMLRVTTADIERVGQLIDKAVEAGANRVQGVYFTFARDKLEELNTLARQRAVEDAKAKADIIASSLGVKIIGVAGALEQTVTRGWEYAPAPAPRGVEIMPPTELEVSVMVEVTYIIE